MCIVRIRGDFSFKKCVKLLFMHQIIQKTHFYYILFAFFTKNICCLNKKSYLCAEYDKKGEMYI